MTTDAFQQKKADYPLRFDPHYKDYLWGGDRIARHFHRPTPPGIQAESWEISIRPEGPSTVINGPLAGTPLVEIYPRFPLLIKILDARDTLSVQVHPDETAARRHGGEPKTEMWYILAAEPGAAVYCGLKPGTDESKLRAALVEGTVADLLHKIPVSAGEAIFVPGGTVHAIGAGCLLLECQQNSDTTYRLFDWNRKGPDGKPRQLHIEQAIRCIAWGTSPNHKVVPTPLPPLGVNPRTRILNTPFFTMERILLGSTAELTSAADTYRMLFVASGIIEIRSPGFMETAPAGTTYLLPPALPATSLQPIGNAELLLIAAPKP